MMTEKLPREVLVDLIAETKTKGVTAAVAKAMGDAIFDGLERKGFVIAESGEVLDRPDANLTFLKTMRTRLSKAVNDDETPPRDLASLSRRLQEVIRDVSNIEERLRAEKPKEKVKTGGAAAHSSGPATAGSLDF